MNKGLVNHKPECTHGTWSACVLSLAIFLGCGKPSDVGPGPTAQTAAPTPQTSSEPTPANDSASPTANANGTAGDADTPQVDAGKRDTENAESPEVTARTPEAPVPAPMPPKVKVAAPTDEQVASWTPAPFESLQLLAIREWEKSGPTASVATVPDGQHFITAGVRVLLWSVAQDQPEHVLLDFSDDDPERIVLSLAVSPDGKWCVAGDSTGTVRVWNLEDSSEIVAKKLGATGIPSLAVSPDGQELATISYNNEVFTWNPTTLEPIEKFKVNTDGVKRIEYVSPNLLAVAGASTALWNTRTGERAHELPSGRYSFALARSPDGSQFMFGSDDSLRIWNVNDSKVETSIAGGVSGSEILAFSPDGKLLATSNGRSLQIWNVEERRVAQVIDGFGWLISGLGWLPQTNLLVVASENGCTRLWGTASQGEPLGWKPLNPPVPLPEESSDAPATPDQLQQVIDLRTFPRFPGGEPSSSEPDSFHYVVAASPPEIQTFYRYFLEQARWSLDATASADPAALLFRKGAFTLAVNAYDAGDGKTTVMLQNGGSYDLRRAPKFDRSPIETVYEAANTVIYKTKANLAQIETSLLRKFVAAGWVGYVRLHSGHQEQPDGRNLSFLRNGATLNVTIGKFPTDPSSYTVQYSLFSGRTWVPVPPEIGFVEFDGSTEPSLVATTKQSFDQVREFYDTELTRQGWSVRDLGRSLKEDRGWLTYLRGQHDLTIGLAKLPDERTLVLVGKTKGSLWEESQKKEEPAKAGESDGLEAADFPGLEAAHTMAVDRDDKSIEVTVEKSTLADAAEQFTKLLADRGWVGEDGGIRGEDYTMLRFKKKKKEITLRARPKDGSAVVNFQGDGLLWNKELSTDKALVSFETWLRRNKLAADLEHLDRYEQEFVPKAANE